MRAFVPSGTTTILRVHVLDSAVLWPTSRPGIRVRSDLRIERWNASKVRAFFPRNAHLWDTNFACHQFVGHSSRPSQARWQRVKFTASRKPGTRFDFTFRCARLGKASNTQVPAHAPPARQLPRRCLSTSSRGGSRTHPRSPGRRLTGRRGGSAALKLRYKSTTSTRSRVIVSALT